MLASTLIDAAMSASALTSEREFARRLGVSHTTIGQWRSGERFPTFEAAAAMAAMAGLPPTQTAAQLRLQAPEGKKHAKILRQIANAAAIFIAIYTSADALPSPILKGPETCILCKISEAGSATKISAKHPHLEL